MAVGGGTPSGPAPRRVGLVSEDDREAVRRVQAGDTEAFEPLVEKYKRKVFRLAYQVLRDQEEALDVAQEAFVKAFRALPAFKGDSAFYTWLFRITMNVALDRKRQRATRAKSLGAEDVPPEEWERTATSTDPDPEDVAAGVERRERIRKGSRFLVRAPPSHYHPQRHRRAPVPRDRGGARHSHGDRDVPPAPRAEASSRGARPRFRALSSPPSWGSSSRPGPRRPSFPRCRRRGSFRPPRRLRAEPPAQQVCVYALVMFASNPPGGDRAAWRSAYRPSAAALAGVRRQTGLAPTPDLANPAPPPGTAPPVELQSGCGQPSGSSSGCRGSRRCSSTPTTSP